MDTPCMSTLLMMSVRYTKHNSLHNVHIHTSCCGKGNNLHTVHSANLHCWRWRGIHHAHPHCMRQKRIHPHVYTTGGGKENTHMSTLLTVHKDRPLLLHCWLWKWINPHFHTAGAWWKRKCRNVGVPETISPASVFLPLVNRVSPGIGIFTGSQQSQSRHRRFYR